MKFLIIITAALLLAACAPDSPEAFGMAFCANIQKGDDAKMNILLSPSLKSFIKDAETANDKIAKAAPDEKPPLGDGIPWKAYQDYAPLCRVGNLAAQGDVQMVDIHHGFADTPNADWTDRLVLIQQDGKWMLDDVRYGPGYDSGLRAQVTQSFSGYEKQ